MASIELIEEVEQEFWKAIRKNLPPSWLAPYSGSIDLSFHASLNDNNVNFKNSIYCYDGPLKFVHWTSLSSLHSIINNREFRLYNLQNSSDPNEFKFAAESLNVNIDQIEHSKNYLFTLSFCEQKNIDSKYLWTEYGKNSSGVAIEFEIINNPDSWIGFMLSKVYYELPAILVNFKRDLDLIYQKYPGVVTKIDLGKLIAYHKETKFTEELEIRLSNYFPYSDLEEYLKYCNTEFKFDPERPRITEFMSLPLWVNNESPYVKSNRPELDRSQLLAPDFFATRPQIKITQIYFGENCGISNLQFDMFRRKLDEIIRYKLGYKVDLLLNLYKANIA